MRTSRIAQETSRIVTVSPSKAFSRRQTRAFAASLSSFTANGASIGEPTVKSEDQSDDSSLSSIASAASFDIEDCAFSTVSHKRKRGIDSPSTTVTSASSNISIRTSPRKAGVKVEDGESKVKKARKQPAKRLVHESGEVEIHPPANWEEIYEAVRKMRKKVQAPVDTMGCETLAEEHLSPRDKRFQTLIALMLSSQTKDTTNALAMRRLQTELPPPGLTLENILAVDPVKLNELIWAVGFHNNKTRYIKAAALILRDKFAGDIPDTIEGLISLPGVGPKMGYLCLSAAWGKTEGIGVDVHVHRITNLWGWHKTKGPEETREALQSWLPRERWHEINHLLVGFGQTICLPVGRRCGECTLSGNGLCPSAVVEKQKKWKVKSAKVEVERNEAVVKEEVDIKDEEVLADDVR